MHSKKRSGQHHFIEIFEWGCIAEACTAYRKSYGYGFSGAAGLAAAGSGAAGSGAAGSGVAGSGAAGLAAASAAAGLAAAGSGAAGSGGKSLLLIPALFEKPRSRIKDHWS
jgi:hypothetical protein